MRALALIALLLPLTADAGMLGGGKGLVRARTSPTAARYEFTTTGGDWAVPPEAPAPVIDCRGDFRSGACGATQFTASGSPGLASTYWRPGGGSTGGSGVAFDGVDDLLSSATAATCAGDQFACVRFRPSNVSSVQVLMARDAGSPNQDFLFFINSSGNVQAAIYAAGGTSLLTLGAVAIGQEYVACFAYDYVADGTSILRGNLSGAVPSEVTNAKGPPKADSVTVATTIGANGATPAVAKFTGTISGAIRGCYAPSASDLARMVRSQYAAQGSLGEPLTVTRASAKTCSIGGAWFTVPSGQPCIGDAGLSVEGSRTQYALNNCTAPADQTVTLSAGAHTLWLEGTGTVAAAVGTATATGLPCTATSASSCSFTVSVGGTVTLDVEGTVSRMQVENGARSSLICATTTPVTRAADVVSAPHGIAGNRWCVRGTYDPTVDWRRGADYHLWAIGTGANSASLKVTYTNLLVLAVTDAAAADRYIYKAMPTGSDPMTITACNDGGTLNLYYSGVLQSVARDGAGTGTTATLAAPLSIGTSSAGTLQFGGTIGALTTCNTSIPEECQ